MPPGRSTTAAKRQSTLAFAAKVTKSAHTSLSTSKSSKAGKPVPLKERTPSPAPVSINIDDGPQEEAVTAVSDDDDENEACARKISESQISKYYTSILESRLSAPVHQQSLSVEEKILRHFDLSSQFGPCIGITRVNRWKRAQRLGLNPPLDVLAVALQMEDEHRGEVEGKRDRRIAYLDDYFSTRTAKED